MRASSDQFVLSSTLYNFCNTTLGQCDKFNSYESLQTVFNVEGLNLYKHNLPRAGNGSPAEQIDLTMSYLLNKIHKGQPVFLIFLRRLLAFYVPEDDLHQELSKCGDSVEIEYFLFQAKQAREKGLPVMLDGSRHDLEDVVKLVEHLRSCPYMSNRELRKRVVSHLSAEIVQDIERNEQNSDFADVWHILKACSRYPDGVGQLTYVLFQLGGETVGWLALDKLLRDLYKTHVTYTRLKQLQAINMQWPKSLLEKAYDASKPEGWEGLNITDLADYDADDILLLMVEDLAKVDPKRAGKVDPMHLRSILEFVEHLAYYAEKREEQSIQVGLREWVNRRANELGISDVQLKALRSKVKNFSDTPATYLLITVGVRDEQTFEIQAWLLNSQNKLVEKAKPYTSKRPVTLDGIPKCIDEIRIQYASYLSENLRVELFLPKDLLCCAVDHWQIDAGMIKAKFGVEHKLVVRSLERAGNVLIRGKWQDKWEKFRQFRDGKQPDENKNPTEVKGLVWVCKEEACKEKNLFYNTLHASHIVCLALGFVPPSPHATHVFDVALSAGIPIALWPRQQTNPPGTFSDLFESLLFSEDRSLLPRNLLELPLLIWEQRVKAVLSLNEHHYGHHLTLLWDEPVRLPQDMPSEFPPQGLLQYQH